MNAFASCALVALLLATGCAQPPAPGPVAPGAPGSLDAAEAVRHLAGSGEAQVVPAVRALLQATGSDGAEPTIGVDAAGRLYVTAAIYASDALGVSYGPHTDILRSDDGGATWIDISPTLGGQKTHPTTGDPLLFLDTDTNRLFDIDQLVVACNYLSTTDDFGATWRPPTDACPLPASDHMTLVTAKPTRLPATPLYPKTVYFCSNQFVDTQCGTSVDGGLTFQSATPPFVTPPPTASEAADCTPIVGHLKDGADGALYLPNACDRPVLAITRDAMLTWTLATVSQDPAEDADPAVAVAADGTLYYAYLARGGHLKLASSRDGGASWSLPLPIAAPGVTAANLPAMAAGAGDRVVVAYYGTRAPGGYPAINKGAEERDPPPRDNVTWDGYLAIVDGASTAEPSVLTVRVNPADDPLVRGHCGPRRCKGVLDFIDVQVDRDGRPWAAFVDTCLEACIDGTEADSVFARGLVATLAEGPSLLDGTPLVPVHGVKG